MLGCGTATLPLYVGSGAGGRQSEVDTAGGVPAEELDEPVDEGPGGCTAEYDGSPCGGGWCCCCCCCWTGKRLADQAPSGSGAGLTAVKAGGGPSPAAGRTTDENCGGGCVGGSSRVAAGTCGATTEEKDGGAAVVVGSAACSPLCLCVPGDQSCTFALSGT